MKKIIKVTTFMMLVVVTSSFAIADDESSSNHRIQVEDIIDNAPNFSKQSLKTATPTDEECYIMCSHFLFTWPKDLQASEYRKCFRECRGTL